MDSWSGRPRREPSSLTIQDSARNDLNAEFEIRTVDGDGNQSQVATAQKIRSQTQIYEALGDFSPTQSGKQWAYEEESEDSSYRELVWDNGGL